MRTNNELENKKILVIEEVEDDASIQKMLHIKFTQEGFRVLDARDGEEGLKIALSEHPDLILLDIIMPKMDGLTMMKKLREADEWGKNVPVILLTNKNVNDDEVVKGVADNKPTYYLHKSNYTPNELVKKIRERLSV
jgi:DNA-binding response OmpR family regulator